MKAREFSLEGNANEFGTYAYLSWCLETGTPLPIDLMAHLESRGWIIQDVGELKPADVGAMTIVAEEEQLDLFNEEYSGA